MSDYHPLDVRHPSNQRYANPNYLLDPPAASKSAPSRAPAALESRSDAATREAADVARSSAQPWGRGPLQSPITPTTPTRGSGFWRTGFWLVLFGAVIAWQNGYYPAIERWARMTALDLGLPWPF